MTFNRFLAQNRFFGPVTFFLQLAANVKLFKLRFLRGLVDFGEISVE